MMKIVATNVVASQPPERRPTATPTACAKNFMIRGLWVVDLEKVRYPRWDTHTQNEYSSSLGPSW